MFNFHKLYFQILINYINILIITSKVYIKQTVYEIENSMTDIDEKDIFNLIVIKLFSTALFLVL